MRQSEGILFDLILKASEMGADEIEIEYKDGYEEIFALSGMMGVGIDRLKSSSKEASKLREQIYNLKNRKKIRISDEVYKIQIEIFDSFGEDTFRVKFQKV